MQGGAQRCRGTSSQITTGIAPTNIRAYRTPSFHQSNHLSAQTNEPIYEQPRRKVHFDALTVCYLGANIIKKVVL